MIAARIARSALLGSALLFGNTLVPPSARAQPLAPANDSNYSSTLRDAIAVYRTGDSATAEQLLRAQARTDPDAEAWLGAVLLDRGQPREALKALQHAADAGSAEANHRLAIVYAEGLAGVTRDEQRAVELFRKAADAGHRRAQINLGILYMRGQGVPRDLLQARAWLEKAAATDDPNAMYALARAMDESDGPIAADSIRAADLYRRAAEKGNAQATLRYGLALLDGVGVRKDPVAAQTWLLKAKDAGVPEAALALGDLSARTPSTKDKAYNEKIVETALSWYRVAAAAGVPSGQFKLANAYFAGTGVPRDPGQALLWYGRASQQGLAEAQNALGIMLLGGVAGPQDKIEGYKWLILAEAGGYPDSRSVREKAKDEITAQERTAAEAAARSFRPVLERPIDEQASGAVPGAPRQRP